MTNTHHLTAETETEFAAALDQAIATGRPVQAPAEVAERFGLDDHGPDSAEAADVQGRPWIKAVSEPGTPDPDLRRR